MERAQARPPELGLDRTVYPPYLSHLAYEIDARDYATGPGNGAMDSTFARTNRARRHRPEIPRGSPAARPPRERPHSSRRRSRFGQDPDGENDGGLHSDRLS